MTTATATAQSRAADPAPPRSGNVDVWILALDTPAASRDALSALLSPEELARARRMRFDRDRDRFVTAHGLMREVLACYLGRAPAGLDFSIGAHGKPSLVRDLGDPDLRFNLSHSGGKALLAVSVERELGVDLERLSAACEDDFSVARAFFSAAEVSALTGLSPEQRPSAFLRCWTRKEAWVKARGEGLSLPLDQFDVSLRPGEPAALLRVAGDPAPGRRWRLIDLGHALPNFEAALAVEACPTGLADVRIAKWPDDGTSTGNREEI